MPKQTRSGSYLHFAIAGKSFICAPQNHGVGEILPSSVTEDTILHGEALSSPVQKERIATMRNDWNQWQQTKFGNGRLVI